MATRIERDSMGEVVLPADAPWGAQTQRSIEHFRIGTERMPEPLIRALAEVKRAAARVNGALGALPAEVADAVVAAADEVIAGRHPDAFPLVVWQTGSGTQTNMNVNEVVARRASQLLGGRPVHPNDVVNRSQSTNDVFPTALHLAALDGIDRLLVPAVSGLRDTLASKATAFDDIVKIGRTHLQDATPLTLGQEFSGWVSQLDHALARVAAAREGLLELAVGGTAVGTGLNAPEGWDERVCAELAARTGLPLRPAPSKFEALGARDAALFASGALRSLAVSLAKIAGDVRLLASGPRCGLGELVLPANEPGSSIMPGKVNPTQVEALTMVTAQVIGNDAALAFAAASGHLQLNATMPLVAQALLQSIRLLGDAAASFDRHCARGIEPDRERIAHHLERSLMLVTALAPEIGYDRAAAVAKRALAEGRTLREVAVDGGFVSGERFDALVRPERMTRPGSRG